MINAKKSEDNDIDKRSQSKIKTLHAPLIDMHLSAFDSFQIEFPFFVENFMAQLMKHDEEREDHVKPLLLIHCFCCLSFIM